MHIDYTVIIVAAIAGFPPTLLAAAAWRQSRNNGKEVAKNTEVTLQTQVATDAGNKKVEEVCQKTAELTAQADTIYTQTNSTLSDLLQQNAEIKRQNAEMAQQGIDCKAQIVALQNLVALLVERAKQ